jgi:hypothetical protein
LIHKKNLLNTTLIWINTLLHKISTCGTPKEAIGSTPDSGSMNNSSRFISEFLIVGVSTSQVLK